MRRGGGGDDNADSITIGRTGGTVEDADGARVVIPEGALTQSYDISITSFLSNDEIPQGVAPMLEMWGGGKAGAVRSEFQRVGETSDHPDVPLKMIDYIYDTCNGNSFSGYVRITVVAYNDCTRPDFVLTADESVLQEGENTSVEASLSCAGVALTGKEITFDIQSGPGEINPGNTTTNSSGTATATFTAGDENALVRASKQVIPQSIEMMDDLFVDTVVIRHHEKLCTMGVSMVTARPWNGPQSLRWRQASLI